ncbi:hypothetical protein L1887_42735 [Cichorium endivia]|nr:hypothetical protein L1887_42735 [Cichorium endivia]
MDEVSLHCASLVAELRDGEILSYQLEAADFGLAPYHQEALAGGTPEENRDILTRLLQGKGEVAHEAAVAANVAMLMRLHGEEDLKANVQKVLDVLRSGAAYESRYRTCGKRPCGVTRTAFILECKKASPSKGVIRDDFDPARIAGIYKHHASAISVLTDEKYFSGQLRFFCRSSAASRRRPILCKDFIIDPYQIWLARFYQADALPADALGARRRAVSPAFCVAHSLNMGVLTEVSNEEELERAIALEAKVVGINNRDLRDLSIDLNRTRQLAPRLGSGVTVISESGINSYAQVRELSHFANGFLIGSAMMEHDDLNAAVASRAAWVKTKSAALTREQDARAAYEAGAIYGGADLCGLLSSRGQRRTCA